MSTEVSETQLAVILKLTEPGSDGLLRRYPGGFWTTTSATWRHVPLASRPFDAPDWSVTVQTVRSMEKRGLLRRAGRYAEEWRDDRELTDAWLDLGLSIGGHEPNEGDLSQLSRAELERMPTDELDRAAFGFARDDVIEVPVDEIRIRYAGDLENAEYSVRTASQARRVLEDAPPVEVVLRGGALDLEDGHHRYVAARLLGLESLTAVVRDIDDNPINAILSEHEPNARSAKTLEAERIKAQIARGVMRDRIREDREQLDALESQKRGEVSRLNRFARAARARTVLDPTTMVRGDRCYLAGEERQRELRQEVDAFYEARRLAAVAPIEAEEVRVRHLMDRHREEAGLHSKSGQRAASQLRGQQRREAQAESDDAVEHELEPALVPVWRKMKRHFPGSPKMSRAEQFLHWVGENPDEVTIMIAESVTPTEQQLRSAQEAEQVEREQELIYETEPEAVVEDDVGDVPFN